MKPIYLIPFLATVLSSHAQTTEKSENKQNTAQSTTIDYKGAEPDDSENMVFNTAGLQVRPEFPGGTTAFNEFIMSNFYAPPIEDGPKTVKAYISFVVEKDGSVTSIKILKDPGYGIGQEAIRVLKLSPKWKPGMQNGKVVRTSFNLPLTLNLKRAAASKSKFGQ